MKFLLHIGLPKTGSSSLQHALWDNRDILRRHGVVYPLTGIRNQRLNPKHKNLLEALLANLKHARMPEDWINRFHEETAGAAVCVLSDEGFSYFEKPEVVTSLIPRDRTRVVMYVREPVSYVSSRYRHDLTSSNMTMSLREFADSFRLPYLVVAERWGRVFGRENVEVRLIDFPSGKWDIVSDFWNLIGLETENIFPTNEYNMKPGIGGNLLFVKRVLNYFITDEEGSGNYARRGFRAMDNLEPNFCGNIPVDQETVDLIASKSQEDLNVLARRFGLSVKPLEKPVEAPSWPDLCNLEKDFMRILAAARESKFEKLAPLLERLEAIDLGSFYNVRK